MSRYRAEKFQLSKATAHNLLRWQFCINRMAAGRPHALGTARHTDMQNAFGRQDAPFSFWNRAAFAIGGGALVASGWKRGSIVGWLRIMLGLELIRRGFTGQHLFSKNAQSARRPKSSARMNATLQEKVDLGSELSFPASDPPAY
jgi:hypothetical protein